MGNVLMRNLLSGQFAGPIMLVNPAAPRWRGAHLSQHRCAPADARPGHRVYRWRAARAPHRRGGSANAARARVMVMANQLDTTLGADGRRADRTQHPRDHPPPRDAPARRQHAGHPGAWTSAQRDVSQIAARPGKLGFVSQRDTVGTMVLDWALRKKVGFRTSSRSATAWTSASARCSTSSPPTRVRARSCSTSNPSRIAALHVGRARRRTQQTGDRDQAGRSPNNPLMGVSDPLFLEMPNLVSHDDVHDAALRRAASCGWISSRRCSALPRPCCAPVSCAATAWSC